MKRIGYSILYLVILHLLSLIIFSFFRLYLLCDTAYEFPVTIDATTKSIAFIKGLWFDNVIACYVMILPLAIMWIANYFKTISRKVFDITTAICCTLFSIAFLVSAANIPYFAYFFNNINSSILNWVEYGGTTGGMIIGESSYYLPLTAWLITTGVYWWLAFVIKRQFSQTITSLSLKYNPRNIVAISVIGCTAIALCAFGIRGRTGYNPIKVSQAYYCQDPFLNQLGINPMFNLLTSILDDMRKENRPIELLPESKAIENAQMYLNRKGIDDISPIAAKISADTIASRKNVIIILMESMSAHLMGTYGNTQGLTPYLDSLANVSQRYDNCYSAGLHTNHGIYATLYSFPTILKRNAMKGTKIPVYSGLPTVLAENGYHNMFFMTHESQYDNMNAFLRTNGFHEIHSQENYPADKVVNSFGVPDDFLFSYALDRINRYAQTGQPFMSVLLTISNHPPYIIPPHFSPKSTETHEQIVEYADYSIKQFMTMAEKQPWYDNTLFVLLGDHGKLVGNPECEMPQSHNHIPFLIHGKEIAHRLIGSYCGQIDVAPTLLDILGIGYVQNNFGVNLEKESRRYIFYTNDKHIAARDSSRLFIYDPIETNRYYYRTNSADGIPVATAPDSVFEEMEKYGFSMLQSAQYMTKNRYTTDEPNEILHK